MTLQKTLQKGKFSKFGLTFHPEGGNKINWKNLTKKEITKRLVKLNFVKPVQLSRILLETKIFKESKKDKRYYSEASDFGGQLELGGKNNIPHYQIWIELTSKNTATKVLKYYSLMLYGKEFSSAVGVTILSKDAEDYMAYCKKDDRANLFKPYQHIMIDKTIGNLDKYLEVNPEAKKYLKILIAIKTTSQPSSKKRNELED